MDFKRSALAKAGDKLIKALELAESFKKRKNRAYTRQISRLTTTKQN
jgi:hypothetical protein